MNDIFLIIKNNKLLDLKEYLRYNNLDLVSYNLENPLIYASRLNNIDALKLILETKLLDINDKDIHGNTALHHASKNGSLGIVKLLVENNADINCLNNENETPLHLCGYSNNIVLFEYLINNNAITNIYTKKRRNILFYSLNDVKYFIYIYKKTKLNINLTDIDNNNLLIEAAKNNNYLMCRYLLSIKIHKYHKNRFKENAIFFAVKNNNKELIRLFLDNNYILTHKNIYNESLFDINPELENYLMELKNSNKYLNYINKYKLNNCIMEEDIDGIKKIINNNIVYYYDDLKYSIQSYARDTNNKEIIEIINNYVATYKSKKDSKLFIK